jgi:hypothetical protein
MGIAWKMMMMQLGKRGMYYNLTIDKNRKHLFFMKYPERCCNMFNQLNYHGKVGRSLVRLTCIAQCLRSAAAPMAGRRGWDISSTET